jgi:flagellar motor switch protein FliN/FliY
MDPLTKVAADLAEEWKVRFGQALEPLIGAAVLFDVLEPAKPDWNSPSLCWKQQFSGGPDVAHYVAAPERTWTALAAQVLEAAGLDAAGDDEAQSTYIELLSQSAAGLAQRLTARVGQEVLCIESAIVDPASYEGLWIPVRIVAPVPGLEPVYVSANQGLLDLWHAREPQEPEAPEAPQAPAQYGTLDLLLDVELPVSVSFGRASLRIKDVLKLTTGSVVELDRAVTEPVDVVVNNCVVARGEVVVIEGNYGVRIAQILSREERIRSVS